MSGWRERKILRFVRTVFFIFLPTLACFFTVYLMDAVDSGGVSVFLYLLTIIYILVFFDKKFENPAILPISMILTLIPVFIYDYLNPDWLQYLLTMLVALFYALPFTVITVIAAIIINRKRKHEAHLARSAKQNRTFFHKEATMPKLQMTVPLVEMDGDEMTRVLWQMIKDTLILPFVDLKTEYYDLGLQSRNNTDDQITIDAANAAKKYGVAVKCATITPNKQRMEEYPELKKMWKSPNATIRSILDGTVFRAPIVVPCISPVVKSWEAPITIARHAYGDVYAAVEYYAEEPGEMKLIFTGESGEVTELPLPKQACPAVWQAQHNRDDSIRSFAKSCFQYAIATKQDLWFSTKDTISKVYDGRFKEIFEQEFETFKPELERLGITYFYTLIDDAIARVIRSRGGYIWALKNYDGDVMSDMVSTAFGSLAMMTSVLVSPDGNYEYEAAHGTVTQHYYRFLNGEETSTNPIATIFAWTGALNKRAELDNLPELSKFAKKLESASTDTIESGVMTSDLARLADSDMSVRQVTSREFLEAVRDRLV